MLNINSKVGNPQFSSPDAMLRKIDALIVENRELKTARELSLADADKMREKLAAKVRWLETQYRALHSQVSGYLHGDDWEHWQKYNEPRFAPTLVMQTSAPRTAPNPRVQPTATEPAEQAGRGPLGCDELLDSFGENHE